MGGFRDQTQTAGDQANGQFEARQHNCRRDRGQRDPPFFALLDIADQCWFSGKAGASLNRGAWVGETVPVLVSRGELPCFEHTLDVM